MYLNLFCISKTSIGQLALYLIFLMLFLSSSLAKAQELNPSSSSANSPKSVQPAFKNQGEQEDFEVKTLFERHYKVQHYRKYKLPIVSNEDNYLYNGSVISIRPSPILRAILDRGLFYPDVISKAYKYQPTLKINKDSLKAWLKTDTSKQKNKDLHFPQKIDSLRIFNFEEIKFLEKSPKIKRFKFWMFTKGLLNPTTYFLELTNKRATDATDILTFISGAKLTFFKEGWIII